MEMTPATAEPTWRYGSLWQPVVKQWRDPRRDQPFAGFGVSDKTVASISSRLQTPVAPAGNSPAELKRPAKGNESGEGGQGEKDEHDHQGRESDRPDEASTAAGGFGVVVLHFADAGGLEYARTTRICGVSSTLSHLFAFPAPRRLILCRNAALARAPAVLV